MGKIVMPKNSALLEEVEAVLKIYYNAGSWLSNDDYKRQLMAIIGDDQYASSYTKKAQITSYFGFTEWEDIDNARSMRRITESGKRFYVSLCKQNIDGIFEELMFALEHVTFGRNNFGSPDSNSDVEPPCLFVRAILDLGYLTYKEYAYLLWKLEDCGKNYTDAIAEVKKGRDSYSFEIDAEAQKYTDAKPIMVLVRWGFLLEDENSNGGKHIVINPSVKNKYYERLRNLKIYNIDKDLFDLESKNDQDAETKMEGQKPFIKLNFTTNISCDFERNRIVFGAPGTGKSYQMEEDRKKLIEMGGGYERVTFHPDYTYSNFVGCYKPISIDKEIKYEFVPGPFMRVLVEALKSGLNDAVAKPYLLVIEEINRAKVAAVFGEVFQLLDRDENGASDYEIHTSEDVKKWLADELHGSLDSFDKIRIPNNMFIWATMNSADQGVFPMDTAFKRRWSFEYKGIDENEDTVGGNILLGKGEHELIVNWNTLRKTINAVLARKYGINEDKLLGPFFIDEKVFAFDENGDIKNPEKFIQVFKSKVIMYLYEDAAKQYKHKLFSGCDSTRYSSICNAFDEIGIDIFLSDFKEIYNELR